MKRIKAKILSNEKAAPGRFRIRLGAPSISKAARPGQFVMVKCSDDNLPLLRRPLSFHKIRKSHFELLYQVIGEGTRLLSQRKRNERLDIIGPLGNGFEELSAISCQPSAILVAGGIGVAPLLALAEGLATKDSKFTVLLGAKTKSHILCEKDFKRLGARVMIATEDGSKGHKGLVTDLLRTVIARRHEVPTKQSLRLLRPRSARARNDDARTMVYACGPKPMLREVAAIARKRKIPCRVSLEERMACGTGVCLGCAVKTMTGYKMVCKDGPIFNAGDIIW